jgi:hypothetical protein
MQFTKTKAMVNNLEHYHFVIFPKVDFSKQKKKNKHDVPEAVEILKILN